MPYVQGKQIACSAALHEQQLSTKPSATYGSMVEWPFTNLCYLITASVAGTARGSTLREVGAKLQEEAFVHVRRRHVVLKISTS